MKLKLGMTRIALIAATAGVAQSEIPTLKTAYSPAKGIGAENGVMRRDPSDIIIAVPTAAGARRPQAFTDNGKGERIEWGVHIGKRKGFLPFIERFDLSEVAK